ncbi:M81 family metallopeptidase [Pelagibius litoralis]|uniref:Microcystinase C n=1 Tax=Pelagibius litoralis TaxID=374515 RepID=A0A967CA96_9PROT|nr:M81 family metallopeptidase [Pelagibius litoralis]NIA67528.1 M81 family metallopeptidase [Pelagibius litoralis]
MARIAVGGFQHETNTFAPSKATYDDFLRPGAWPGLTRGEGLFEAVAGINIGIAGFVEAAQAQGHTLVPLAWTQATPSAHVTEDAYERVVGQIVEDLEKLEDLDGLYLDLHGAMVAEHVDDGEGEMLRRIRAAVGLGLPIVVSLDLHANVTAEMVEHADCLEIYRTYPHVDMAATGKRSAAQLDALIDGGGGRHKAFRQLPFMIPLTSGCTLHGPAQAVYAEVRRLAKAPGVSAISFACGFCPADFPDAGASLVAYGDTQAAADAAAEALYDAALGREEAFALVALPADEAVREAMRLAAGANKPVVLADAQDNAGGGANSDTTGLLRALLAQRAEGAVVANLYDPAAAEAAHAAGEGATVSLTLGGHSGVPGDAPLQADFKVLRLGDGRVTGTGPFYKGAHMQLGRTALLELDGVKVAIASSKIQLADQAMLRHLGVEPAQQKILALKSSVHFRADFQPIAEEILVVASPGPVVLDNRELPFQRLRPGLRIMPLGEVFQP